MRVDKNSNITQAMDESKKNLSLFDQQNAKKQALREKLNTMQTKLRDL